MCLSVHLFRDFFFFAQAVKCFFLITAYFKKSSIKSYNFASSQVAC